MPRGDNPNSRKNLIVNSERTPQQRRKQAQKAGIASGESRSIRKTLTATLTEVCTDERRLNMVSRVVSMAERGNLHAFEIVRDMLGENPKNGAMDTEALKRAREILGGVDSVID